MKTLHDLHAAVLHEHSTYERRSRSRGASSVISSHRWLDAGVTIRWGALLGLATAYPRLARQMRDSAGSVVLTTTSTTISTTTWEYHGRHPAPRRYKQVAAVLVVISTLQSRVGVSSACVLLLFGVTCSITCKSAFLNMAIGPPSPFPLPPYPPGFASHVGVDICMPTPDESRNMCHIFRHQGSVVLAGTLLGLAPDKDPVAGSLRVTTGLCCNRSLPTETPLDKHDA